MSKKLFVLLLPLLCLSACGNSHAEIVLDEQEIYVSYGNTINIDAKIVSEGLNKNSITYTSLDNNVATVDENGIVTGIKEGEVDIKLSASGATDAICRVFVLDRRGETPIEGKWSKEKAWEWYNKNPFIVGYNGYPSNCVNRIAMWQEYNHDAVIQEIKDEMPLAKECGFNAYRFFLDFETWLDQHDTFMTYLEEYIDVYYQNGMRLMPIFGNDCTPPKVDYKRNTYGPQPVVWGHHGGMLQYPHLGEVPGYALYDEPEYETRFLEMVEEIATKYKNDERILLWNAWNEIGNDMRLMTSVPLAKKTCDLLRNTIKVSQPVTMDAWRGNSYIMPENEEEKWAVEYSDVVSFHFYTTGDQMARICKKLAAWYDRPMFNTEWLHRILHNDVVDIMPVFYKYRVGNFLWGLIQGYYQSYEPWSWIYDEYQKGYTDMYDIKKWQHDLYHFNHCPYDVNEIKCIRHYADLF